jgi:hypothetical protein
LFEIVRVVDLENENPALAIGFVSHDVQMNAAFPNLSPRRTHTTKKSDGATRSAHRITNGTAGVAFGFGIKKS